MACSTASCLRDYMPTLPLKRYFDIRSKITNLYEACYGDGGGHVELENVAGGLEAPVGGGDTIIIQAESAGCDGGDLAAITINNVTVEMSNDTKDHRGLHIVVINPSTGGVELARVFDTYESSDDFDSFTKN